MTHHIHFCLDEIICEIEAADAFTLPEAERVELNEHVSRMRFILAGIAARRAAVDLATPMTTVKDGATADDGAIEPEPTMEIAVSDTALPPPVAPIPAPVRVLNKVGAKPTAEVAPAVHIAAIANLPATKAKYSGRLLTRIAASLALLTALGIGVNLPGSHERKVLLDGASASLMQGSVHGQSF